MIIGIRAENKGPFERRTPLTPENCALLIKDLNLQIHVQSSHIRCFSDAAYQKVGCKIVSDFSNECRIILGVKEIPDHMFESGKTYIFFSHTHKGQPYRMNSLKHMIKEKITLIDYELIANNRNERLVYFGRTAGQAGMGNALHCFGKRLQQKGISSPLNKIKQSYQYGSLDEIKKDFSKISEEILQHGIGKHSHPFIIGISGYGNVSHGAQYILDMFPSERITAEELMTRTRFSQKKIYVVVFEKSDMFVHKKGKAFDLLDYSIYGKEHYISNMESFFPKLSIFVNGIYWEDKFPRLMTREFAQNYFANPNAKLKVIGDITADPCGSIEITEKVTSPSNPAYIYNGKLNSITDDLSEDGVVIMAVDFLPAELSLDASVSFGNKLTPFIKHIVLGNYELNDVDTSIIPEIRDAIILWNGKLTDSYKHIFETQIENKVSA
jgi:alanine dehydrogenase